jgi:hypothetical protein
MNKINHQNLIRMVPTWGAGGVYVTSVAVVVAVVVVGFVLFPLPRVIVAVQICDLIVEDSPRANLLICITYVLLLFDGFWEKIIPSYCFY